MEVAGDVDLRAFGHKFNSRCYSKRTAKYVIEQTIDVLYNLWTLDLFHRDIKSNNFVVTDYD